jgi:hypothetical protein
MKGVPIDNALTVARHLDRNGGATLEELAAEACISEASAKRLLHVMREQLGMRIEWTGQPGVAGGEYVLEDWGILDDKRVLREGGSGELR